MRKPRNTSKLRITAFRASNAENASVWWRHHGIILHPSWSVIIEIVTSVWYQSWTSFLYIMHYVLGKYVETAWKGHTMTTYSEGKGALTMWMYYVWNKMSYHERAVAKLPSQNCPHHPYQLSNRFDNLLSARSWHCHSQFKISKSFYNRLSNYGRMWFWEICVWDAIWVDMLHVK